jgi:hypothetical protein
MLVQPEGIGRNGLLDRFFVRGVVAGVGRITPRMLHIRLAVGARAAGR